MELWKETYDYRTDMALERMKSSGLGPNLQPTKVFPKLVSRLRTMAGSASYHIEVIRGRVEIPRLRGIQCIARNGLEFSRSVNNCRGDESSALTIRHGALIFMGWFSPRSTFPSA